MAEPATAPDPFEAGIDLDFAVGMIVANPDSLTEDHLAALTEILPAPAELQAVYGADFDMLEEVNAQVMAVRALRDHVLRNGRVRAGIGVREIKEVVGASTTLLSTLMKVHSQVLSFDRQRAIEKAVVSAMDGADDTVKDRFFSALETNLEALG